MSRRKKDKPTHKEFESRYPQGQFVMLAMDMLRSPAWTQLTLRQRGLYVMMKMRYNPNIFTEGITVESSNLQFNFPKATWGPLYNNNSRAWRLDLNMLIKLGFIEIVESGWTTRTKNVYKFSAHWKNITQNNLADALRTKDV